MDPTLKLQTDIDVMALSPMLRGMVLTLRYADEHDGIGLTKSDAMNRKFVHWAAAAFNWPGHTSEELFIVNKVLNEHDLFPLWPVRNLLHHLKLIRRYKGTLRATALGRSLAAEPGRFFDLVAPLYLYRFVHDEYMRIGEDHGVLGNWHIFLNLINIEARQGCKSARLIEVLYGMTDNENYDPHYGSGRSTYRINVLRPLCWLGLLSEETGGKRMFKDSTYHKTALWMASLKLESDNQSKLRLVK
jgi:hypothetical protein